MKITNNSKAIAWMVLGAVVSSFFAFIVVWRETDDYPFVFAVWHNAFAFLGVVVLVLIFQPRLLRQEVISVAIRPPKGALKINLTILPCIVSGVLTFPVFSFATKYIHIIPAAIIYGVSPIFLVILNRFLSRKSEKYNPLTLGTWLLLILGLIGFGFVVIGQSGSEFSGVNSGAPWWTSWWGSGLLVLFAAFLDMLSPAFSLKHGAMVREKIKEHTREDIEETFCTLISLGIHRLVAGVFAFFIALYFNEAFTLGILAGLLTGAGIATINGFAVRHAHQLTPNLGVNAITYTTPLFAVAWLMLFTDPNFANPGLLVVGASVIIAVNVLINFQAEIRLGYKALVIALWCFGAVVYFREGVEFGDYYNAIVIAATMFILILSFRTDRLVRRADTEEEIFLSLWWRIPALLDGDRANAARQALLKISKHTSPDKLRAAYEELKSYFPEPIGEAAEAAAQIDRLSDSKQQGSNFGELVSLFILALVTVGGLLFFLPPEVSGWGGFFAEMSAFLLAATVVFSYCSIRDLQEDRNRPILLKKSEGGYSPFSIDAQNNTQNHIGERCVSVIVCTGITLAYAWLLCVKWLGESPLDIVCELLVGVIRTPLC